MHSEADWTSSERSFKHLAGRRTSFGAPYGRWILPTLFKLIAPGVVSRITRRRFLNHLTDIHREDLEEMAELVETGKVKPVIDRCYPLSEVPDAIRYLETMHARAKVVITI